MLPHTNMLYIVHVYVFLNISEYSCGSGRNASEMSQIYSFRSMNTDPDFAPSFALFGDLGSANARSLKNLKMDVDQGMYDTILHVGELTTVVGKTIMKNLNCIELFFFNFS